MPEIEIERSSPCAFLLICDSCHNCRLLRKMSLSISKRSWRRCATPSSPSCTRVRVACQVGCPGDSQGAALHLEQGDLQDQLLKKLTKLLNFLIFTPVFLWWDVFKLQHFVFKVLIFFKGLHVLRIHLSFCSLKGMFMHVFHFVSFIKTLQ